MLGPTLTTDCVHNSCQHADLVSDTCPTPPAGDRTCRVSDTFTSTLWALDFLPWLSKTGIAGMCFHGGPGGPYAAIAFKDGALEVRPLYYGLW